MKTTLNSINQRWLGEDGWKLLLRHLGKTKADDEPLSIRTILEINGLDDALWCLRAVPGYEREKRLLAVRFARNVQHLMTDQRSLQALDVADRFANGEATHDELVASNTAAWDASYDDSDGSDVACDAARATQARQLDDLLTHIVENSRRGG